MRALRLLLILLLAAAGLTGMGQRKKLTVRFHTETNERDSERFAQPVNLLYPPRSTFIERAPLLSERQIIGVHIFEAPDGGLGCVFKLDRDGQIALESSTTQKRGTSLVAFIGTGKGVHQVIDMVIDKPVLDGVVVIQSGLTTIEAEALKKKFKPVYPRGEAPPKKKGVRWPWMR